jgi:hypothetical protein
VLVVPPVEGRVVDASPPLPPVPAGGDWLPPVTEALPPMLPGGVPEPLVPEHAASESEMRRTVRAVWLGNGERCCGYFIWLLHLARGEVTTRETADGSD